MERDSKPLAGIRVIDIADDLGELCGRLLADLGADVIRVEPPSGASSRQAPPFTPDGKASLYFAFRNGGKRGITLDITSTRGCEVLRRLLADADIFIESYKPGRLAEIGLAPEELLEQYPSLVITSMTAFGQTGPYRDFAGTDMVGAAMGGIMYRAGAAHRPPVVLPGAQTYDATSVTAAFATLMAYFKRLKTGRGQWLDISMQEAAASMADWTVPLYSSLGFYTRREGAGMYPLFRCADGWIRVITIGLHQWKALLEWMGNPKELQNPDLEQFPMRVVGRAEIEPIVDPFFNDKNKEDAAREAQARGIPATPCLEPGEVLDNEHTRERGTFIDMEIVPGQRASVASGFFEIDGERVGPTKPAPLAGQHNQDIYVRELGLGADALEALTSEGVI